MTETVEIRRILFPVQLHDGVLPHSVSRRLDHMGFRFAYTEEEVAAMARLMTTSTLPSPNAPNSPGGEDFAQLVEKFCRAGKATVSVGSRRTSHPVHFSTATEFQKWLNLRLVDFAEIFRGYGELTIRVREAGCSAAEGFDNRALTYDRHWCLETVRDQNDCAWLLVRQLRPKVVHMATPCSRMSVAGPRDIDPATAAQNAFTCKVALHQDAEGLGASIENPAGTLLVDR